MAPNNKTRIIEGCELATLRHLLTAEGELESAELNRLSWVFAEIDDKSLFDDDATRIGAAFKMAASHFFVVKVSDLLLDSDHILAYGFTSSAEGVEEFQGPCWHELNLDDCLMFVYPLEGVVLRPGVVSSTFVAGGRHFVDTAIGVA